MNQFRGLSALRTSVIVGYIVAWNAALGVAFYLNHFEKKLEDPVAAAIVASALGLTAVLGALILASPSFRQRLTAPERQERYAPWPFFLITVIAGGMGIMVALGYR